MKGTPPPAFLERLRIQSRLRHALAARGYLEVSTHVLQPAPGSDPRIEAMAVPYAPIMEPTIPSRDFFLHTSPEFAMKRLLCRGLDAIFQIGPAMRQGELGPLHSPEFTMAEWYRVRWSWLELMEEVEQVVNEAAGDTLQWQGREIPLRPPLPRLTMAEVTDRAGADLDSLTELDPFEFSEKFQEIFVNEVEPWLAEQGALFITHFPAPLAVLSKLDDNNPAVAERFELIVAGVEIANGCTELTDPHEHRRRFDQDRKHRRRLGLPEHPPPESFLDDLDRLGLPPCAGVALGVERMAMLATGASRIEEVQGLPFGS